MLIESPWHIVMRNKVPEIEDELTEETVRFIFEKFKVLKMQTSICYEDRMHERPSNSPLGDIKLYRREETFKDQLNDMETYRNLVERYKKKLGERWPVHSSRLVYFISPARWYVNLDMDKGEIGDVDYEAHFSLGPRGINVDAFPKTYSLKKKVGELAYGNTANMIMFSRDLLFELDFVPVVQAGSWSGEYGPLICAGGYPWFFVPVDDKRLVVKAIPKEYDLHEKLYYKFKEQISPEIITDVLKENCISWEEKDGKYFFVFARAVDDVKYDFQKDVFPKLREATKEYVERIKKETSAD